MYIIRIAQVTSRGGILSPGHCFNSQGVGAKSEARHAADNVLRKVKKRIPRKDAWRTHDHGLFIAMISGAFAVPLSWIRI